ncbi:argininosuccinate lyase [Millionella massiliensis]|uniref:argininosuccinate lyase n=1 Tax=Millionella massiliensis TaxID=1871023 RepID=UPI0008DB11DF|nr:argininosuccinate lyase [Millionella massiliensis]
MKLWQKNSNDTAEVDRFTVGRDREMDMYLAQADVLGSLAHTRMLETIGLLTADELADVQRELKAIYREMEAGDFRIEDDVEDIHSQVELMLTRRIGDTGKKIHSGRSRNDQVLVDLRIYLRREIYQIVNRVKALFDTLQGLAEQHKGVLMPGYTHLQIAMPSSFGLWFGAFAESLVDDLTMMEAAYRVCNKNPLGSAAGYGSSFPLDREMTTRLLGFDTLSYNVVYAQMGRGKTERVLAQAMSSVAATLNKLATDNCLFMSQNFSFIAYPPELTTGSSIMPHKKNPDVWELMRSKTNRLMALPNEISMMTTSLPTGYFRDLQLLKEVLFPAIQTLKECIDMADYMLHHIEVKTNILDDPKYDYLFSVEVVNKLVLSGVPFREAYRTVGLDIENGTYRPSREVHHTHAGSIGNLCLDKVEGLMAAALQKFDFDRFIRAEEELTR